MTFNYMGYMGLCQMS